MTAGGHLAVHVVGTPAPQGSKRHVGRGILIESSARVKPWREAVKAATADALGARDPLLGPLSVELLFVLTRPKGHYRTGRNAAEVRASAPTYPAGRPDLDKLVRSTLDALGEAGVWRDDAQVVEIDTAKRYASRAGCSIYVKQLRSTS